MMNKYLRRKYGLGLLTWLLLTMSCKGQERYISQTLSEIHAQTLVYSDTLQLDYYSSPIDTLSSKPLLILVHGGGFAIGKRDNPLEKSFSEEMAKRGFAVASI
ncbi:MAG: alpha/beta hydrolase, partial [Flavobacteriaceae bacterium]